MKLTRLTARSRHGISRSIKREKLEKEGRKTTRRDACCVRIRPEQVFSSAGLARATASAMAAVKRGTDAWPKKSCPVHQAGKVKESRKLGADSPVQLLRLRLQLRPRQLQLLRFRLQPEPGRDRWRLRLGKSWAPVPRLP